MYVAFLVDCLLIHFQYGKVGKLVGDPGYGNFGTHKYFTPLLTVFLGASDIKPSIAALHFIITNGAKYDIDDATLSNELQQLGLPKGILLTYPFTFLQELAEHCDALVRPYRDNKDKLRAHAKDHILKCMYQSFMQNSAHYYSPQVRICGLES